TAAGRARGRPLGPGAATRLHGQVSVFDPRDPAGPCSQCLDGDGDDVALSCGEAGVIGPLVGMVGSLQALEALKLLAGIGAPLVGLLQLSDVYFSRLRVSIIIHY